MTRQPAIFLSHGSPMLPLEPGRAGVMLEQLGQSLDAPRAVLALSPHWMARAPLVGANPQPETIHDFGGFDPRLYTLQYPAAGDPGLAQEVFALLQQAGWRSGLDPQRGLDHGVWIPLRLLRPQADWPVVPLAMPWPLDAAGAYRLGQALQPLRQSGVLLLGSGSLTHNLHEYRPDSSPDEPADPYVLEFSGWFAEQIAAGDVDALLHYRTLAPHAARAHPSDEHLLPLFWALGAAAGASRQQRLAGGVHYRMLSMDGWRWD